MQELIVKYKSPEEKCSQNEHVNSKFWTDTRLCNTAWGTQHA